MGLDLVELVIEVEETFAIIIANDDAPRLVTVGDLYRYVLARVETKETSPCATAQAFYRLRRALGSTVGVDRDRVRPEADLAELIPREGRRDHWARLARSLGVDLPALRRPRFLENTLNQGVQLTIVLALVFLLISGALKSPPVLLVGVGVTTAAALCTFLAFAVTKSFAVEPVVTCRTVRDLVETVAARECIQTVPADRRWTRRAVWVALRDLIVFQLGVRPEDVTDGARFVDDFGAD